MEDDWLSLNTDVEKAILRRHTTSGQYITLTYGSTSWKSRSKIYNSAESRELLNVTNTIFSIYANRGNPSHNEINRGDTAGEYFRRNGVLPSSRIEATPSRRIWRNVRSVLVSDGNTLLPSRILPHQHHDRSWFLLHRSDSTRVWDVRNCWVRVTFKIDNYKSKYEIKRVNITQEEMIRRSMSKWCRVDVETVKSTDSTSIDESFLAGSFIAGMCNEKRSSSRVSDDLYPMKCRSYECDIRKRPAAIIKRKSRFDNTFTNRCRHALISLIGWACLSTAAADPRP